MKNNVAVKCRFLLVGIVFLMLLTGSFLIVGQENSNRDNLVALTDLNVGWNLVSAPYSTVIEKNDLSIDINDFVYSWSDCNGFNLDGDGLGDSNIPYGAGDDLPLKNNTDTLLPILTKTVGIPHLQCPGTTDYCIITSTKINVNVTDNSNQFDVYYKLWKQGNPEPDWTWWFNESTGESDIYIFEECLHYLHIKAVDQSNNTLFDNETFYVDDSPPTFNLTIGDPNCTIMENQYCLTTDTLISSDAVENGCCPCTSVDTLYRIWYEGLWTTWIPYINPISFSEGCKHYLEIFAIDDLGNIVPRNITFYVDDLAPILDITMDEPFCSGCGPNGSHCICTTTPIYINTITQGCCQEIGDVTIYRTWYDGIWSPWEPVNSPLYFNYEGLYYLDIYSYDCVGNNASENLAFFVDDTPPAITNIYDYPLEKYNGDPVNITCSVNEASCGVSSVVINITGPAGFSSIETEMMQGSTYYYNTTYLIPGTYTYYIIATDSIGNQQITTYYSFNVINSLISDFYFEPEMPKTFEEISFNSTSYDLNGNIVNWSWDFGDSNVSYGETAIHSYSIPTIFTVCLTVTDDDGTINTSCQMITVQGVDLNQSMFNRGFPIRHATDGDWAAAQSFMPTLDTLTSAEIRLRRFGNPEFNLTVELRSDHPQGTLLDTLLFTPEEVPSSWGWFNLDFADTAVTPDTDYFIVCPPTPSGVTTSFGYEWGYAFGDQYPNGSFWFTRDGGGLWRDLPTMYEFCFRTYGYYS